MCRCVAASHVSAGEKKVLRDRRIDGPAKSVMIADLALHQLWLHNAYGCFLGRTGLFTDAATGTGIAVDDRHEHRMFA